MPEKLHIIDAGNVTVPAVLILQKKGYTVTCVRRSHDDELWSAQGEAGNFAADDPVTLLGVVTVGEVRGTHWKASDDEIEEFIKKYDYC